MKVTLDLDALLEAGSINQAEYEKFSGLAARGTTHLVYNLLVGFGIVAVSGAAITVLPSAITASAVGVGVVVGGVGLVLLRSRVEQWKVPANFCLLTGALLSGGGIVLAAEGSAGSFLLVSVGYAVAAVATRSSLLTVLSVLSLSSTLGGRADYFKGVYLLGIQAPMLTVVLFTGFSATIAHLSKRLNGDFERMANVAARTGVLLVNFAFWIGSLWGDLEEGEGVIIADWVFAFVWAVGLVVGGLWAWKRNFRWVVQVVAVFGVINLYTQWFERLGASAGTVLVSGLIALGVAFGVRSLGDGANKVA